MNYPVHNAKSKRGTSVEIRRRIVPLRPNPLALGGFNVHGRFRLVGHCSCRRQTLKHAANMHSCTYTNRSLFSRAKYFPLVPVR